MIAIEDCAETIRKGWEEFLLMDQSERVNAPYIYASRYHECTRQMVYEMTCSDTLPEWYPDTLAKFRRGKDRERDLLSDLTRIGRLVDPPFELLGQQYRFELRDRNGRVVIVGKMDARIAFDRSSSMPLEVKSWHSNLTDRIERFDDLFKNAWTRSGAYQLLAYLYGANEPAGFMLLDRSGLPTILPVRLEDHLDTMETFLRKATEAMDYKELDALPDYIDDSSECKRCPFMGGVCNPPIGAKEGTIVFSDPDLEADLDRWHELSEAADEHTALDKRIKEAFRGIEYGVAGRFFVTGKWTPNTTYNVPKEIKERFKEVKEKGRFLMKIERF